MQRNPVQVAVQAGTPSLQPFWHRTAAEEEAKPASSPAAPQQQQQPQRAYEIVPVRSEHYEDVMDFLRRNFFLDEPLNVYLDLVSSSEPGVCPELEEFAMSALQAGVSLMAVSPTGRVMGACINSVSEARDVEELQKMAGECSNPKFRIILGLLAHVEKQSDVHHRFSVDKVFEVPMLSVDSSCRGQGVATALLRGSVQLARRLGLPLFRVDCTSEFTARAVARLGLHQVFSMRYDEYRESPEQEPPLHPDPPHHEVKAYVMALSA